MEDYERIKTVGRGAYGVVQLCNRKRDDALVIIKEIPVEEMTIEERQAALNEVKVLDMLNHPNIVAYIDSFVQDKALMIVMEYAEGGTVFEYLQDRKGDLLPEDEILNLFVQMVKAIQGIHSHNILHRDLKTQNIMLDRTRKVIKIGDFGISKVLSSKSKANTVVGTPCYISPELCEGKPYDQKSDIWALGCVLYEIVALRRAFDAPNLPALVLKIMRGTFEPVSDSYTEELRKLMLSTLHLDPSQRPGPNEILAQPICQNQLLDLYTDIGRVACIQHEEQALSGSRAGSNAGSSARPATGRRYTAGGTRQSSMDGLGAGEDGRVWMFGAGITAPQAIDGLSEVDVAQVAITRTQHYAVSAEGKVLTWKAPRTRPGAPADLSQVVPRLLPGITDVQIKTVACGISFLVLLTDRNILMTSGNGAQGCLGHGDFEDGEHPRIVEALLAVEVASIAAGSAHVAVATKDNEVFTWGCGDNGRLGLGDDADQCLPQRVTFEAEVAPVNSVHCGDDCTIFITDGGGFEACGSNRGNKLGLLAPEPVAVAGFAGAGPPMSPSASGDGGSGTPAAGGGGGGGGIRRQESKISLMSMSAPGTPLLRTTSMMSAHEAYSPMPLANPGEIGLVSAVDLGASHIAVVTDDGCVHTFGSNSYGQLGRNPDLSDSSIVEALRGKKVVDVSCGDSFTVAVTDNNEVYAFGKELEGRIGTEGTGPSMEPKVVAIPNLPTADGAALAGKVGRITSRFNSTLVSMTYTEPDSPAAAPAEPV